MGRLWKYAWICDLCMYTVYCIQIYHGNIMGLHNQQYVKRYISTLFGRYKTKQVLVAYNLKSTSISPSYLPNEDHSVPTRVFEPQPQVRFRLFSSNCSVFKPHIPSGKHSQKLWKIATLLMDTSPHFMEKLWITHHFHGNINYFYGIVKTPTFPRVSPSLPVEPRLRLQHPKGAVHRKAFRGTAEENGIWHLVEAPWDAGRETTGAKPSG